MTDSVFEITVYIFGFFTLIMAFGVVFSKKPLDSALWLIGTLFLLAVNYALLQADFLAVLQVLIYAGAIMVLVVFVIMLLGPLTNAEETNFYFSKVFIILPVIFLLSLLIAVIYFNVQHNLIAAHPTELNAQIKPFGRVLFGKYLFALEITGVLLLATTIGVVALAKEKDRSLPEGRGLRAKQSETKKGEEEC